MEFSMKESEPTISVIIPAYNVEKYIHESLCCLTEQTVSPDELIIIDDGSSDSTLEIIKSFSFPFKSKVFSTENRGVGEARNLGIREATSSHLYFFDSDDLLNKDFIRYAKRKISDHPSLEILFFSGDAFYEDEKFRKKRMPKFNRCASGDNLSADEVIKIFLHNRRWDVMASLYVVKRDLLIKNDLFFHAWNHEDTIMFYQLLFISKTISLSENIFFHKRVRENSIMTMSFNKKHRVGSKKLVEGLIDLRKERKGPLWNNFINQGMKFSTEPYIKSCRGTGKKADISLLFRMVKASKSLKLAVWTSLLLANRNAIDYIRIIKN